MLSNTLSKNKKLLNICVFCITEPILITLNHWARSMELFLYFAWSVWWQVAAGRNLRFASCRGRLRWTTLPKQRYSGLPSGRGLPWIEHPTFQLGCPELLPAGFIAVWNYWNIIFSIWDYSHKVNSWNENLIRLETKFQKICLEEVEDVESTV